MRYLMMLLAVGDQGRFSVPRSSHVIWREHATLSQELLPYLGHGWIRIKLNIQELCAGSVLFEDGTSEPVDAIIYATGYRASFPFIDKEVFAVENDQVTLYRRMIMPKAPGLFMEELVQPTIPLIEIQARCIANVLVCKVTSPPRLAMAQEIERHLDALQKRYVRSARYTLEVDFREYASQLRADMKRGRSGVR